MEMTSSTITMLKALSSSPHPLAGEMVPLTLFDRAAFDLFVPVVLVYPAPTPSNEALKEGLRRALAPCPQLAGRLAVDERGRRCIHFNNEGVLVQEESMSADLADVLLDGSNTDGMYPTLPLPEENIGAALLQIKLSRYKCDSLVMGIAPHHQAADAHSTHAFLRTWASAVRHGTDFTADPFPFLPAAAVHPDVRTPVFDHGSTEFKRAKVDGDGVVVSTCNIKNLKVSFTAEFIAELKARVGAPCTTFQCLLAHMWKKTTQARGLRPEEFTQVRVAVNCRGRAEPPVPPDFFGNMVLWAFPRLQVRDVLASTYGGVVGAIRAAVARIDGEYIRSFLDFGALADAHGLELTATAPAAGTMCCPDLEVDSWLGFRDYPIDFGWGPPTGLLLPDIPVEGLMVFVPSSPMAKGGVDVFIALAEEHVTAFQQRCYSMDTHDAYKQTSDDNGPSTSRL
uniref:Uncharacterized protein n=1 Tax=Avena sativa TaxID=4498 RepID=A0ACD5W9F0_AVESA